MTHANATNARAGSNHKNWYASRMATPGTTPHFIAASAGSSVSSARVGLTTMIGKGSTSQLARGWGQAMIEQTSARTEAKERAFDIAERMMGLGRRAERVGARKKSPARPRLGIAQFLACAEFDACPETQDIFVQLARKALSSKGTHLAMHASYGRANGYRGTHVVADLEELCAQGLRAESRFGARGASIHVYSELDGIRRDLVSFKRKGGDGPSESQPDHLQATLLIAGAWNGAKKLPGTAILTNTGRSITKKHPSALAL